MKYKATAFYDTELKTIDKGHTEFFESDYQISKDDWFEFKNLPGDFLVLSVTIDLKEDVIFLLIAPDIRR